MLKKLLPESLETLVKPIKKDPNQSEPKVKKQNLNSNELHLEEDYNLISSSSQDVLFSSRIKKRISVLRAFVIFVSIIFTLILIVNFILTLVIKAQKRVQDNLVKVTESYSGVEERAKAIDRRVLEYKKLLSKKSGISDKYKFVIDNLGDTASYSSVSVNYSDFSISVKVATPYEFTKLIQRYLSGDVISEIVIESANLDTTDNFYNIYLKGTFK